MDFILWPSSRDTKVKQVMLLYNIECQYKINLYERCKKLPPDLQLRTDAGDAFPSSSDVSPSPSIDVILPVWHGDVHQTVCKTQNSLKYQHGVGLSDGEAPKRLWAVMNPVAMQTKEMQLGVCHDALEDKADHHNFEKNIGMGDLLDWHLKLALEESQIQDKAFKGIDATLKDELQAD